MTEQKVILSAEAYDWLVAWLDSAESDRPCPKLAKLFREVDPFEYPAQDQAGAGATQI